MKRSLIVIYLTLTISTPIPMKQINKALFFSAILLFGCYLNVSAQQSNFYPLLSMQLTVTGVDSLPGGDISISDTTTFNANMMIYLFDTTGISSIQVELRTAADLSDLFQQSYDFNTVDRNGYTVSIPLGSYVGLLHYYGQATIQRTDSSLTDAFAVWK